jgi:hypothetical protein
MLLVLIILLAHAWPSDEIRFGSWSSSSDSEDIPLVCFKRPEKDTAYEGVVLVINRVINI